MLPSEQLLILRSLETLFNQALQRRGPKRENFLPFPFPFFVFTPPLLFVLGTNEELCDPAAASEAVLTDYILQGERAADRMEQNKRHKNGVGLL